MLGWTHECIVEKLASKGVMRWPLRQLVEEDVQQPPG